MDRLCAACQTFDLRRIATTKIPNFESSNINRPWDEKELSLAGYTHLTNAQLLFHSAQSCALCAVLLKITEGLFRMRVRKTHLEVAHEMTVDTLLPLPIVFGSPASYESPKLGGLGLHTLVIAIPFANLDRPPSHAPYVYAPLVGIIAARESPAALSGDVVGRPAFGSADSPEAYDWLKRTLHNCTEHHRICSISMSSALINEAGGTRLPTRVIKVHPDPKHSLQLIANASSQQGRYVALSHCWGPKEKQPIRTLRSNIEDYKGDIPLYSDGTIQSKTFQDAVIITRRLGLQYLWIDSICIVQDDPSDWQHEAAVMDNIYQNAYMTIVAAHAEDGTAGCFFDRTKLTPTPTADVPYRDKKGIITGTFQVRARLPELFVEEHPTLSPARSRAWITQEEFLSRRKVYYTKGKILWVCQEQEVTETNETSAVVSMTRDWEHIVKEYASRRLTYPRDKLVALQGLANAIGTTRTKDMYAYGLWLRDFPGGLLWFGSEDENLQRISELGLPSWTWASYNNAVSFLQLDPVPDCHRSCQLELHGQTLTLHAPLIQLLGADPTAIPNLMENQPLFHGSIFRWPLGIGDIEPLLRAKAGVIFTPAFDLMASWLAVQTVKLFGFHCNRSYLITDRSKHAVGYATLDTKLSEVGESYYVVPLVQGLKWDHGEDENWGFSYALVVQAEVDKQTITSSESKVTYKRTGVAITMSNSWIKEELPSKFNVR